MVHWLYGWLIIWLIDWLIRLLTERIRDFRRKRIPMELNWSLPCFNKLFYEESTAIKWLNEKLKVISRLEECRNIFNPVLTVSFFASNYFTECWVSLSFEELHRQLRIWRFLTDISVPCQMSLRNRILVSADKRIFVSRLYLCDPITNCRKIQYIELISLRISTDWFLWKTVIIHTFRILNY